MGFLKKTIVARTEMTTVFFLLGDFLYREKFYQKVRKSIDLLLARKRRRVKRGQPIPAAIC